MDDICLIGPTSRDRIYHGQRMVRSSTGGVPVYGGLAASHLNVSVQIITKYPLSDADHLAPLSSNKTIRLQTIETPRAMSFDLIYGLDEEPDRTIRLRERSDSFSIGDLKHAEARLIYLAPLMHSDMSADFIQAASEHSDLAVDVQGLLRHQVGGKIEILDWTEKEAVLPAIHMLKASQAEAACLTGTQDPVRAAQQLADWGVHEVIITQDRWGAHILQDGNANDIPAFEPPKYVDSTGCGDTFFAAYLSQRLNAIGAHQAGTFAAAAAALKIGHWGASDADVETIRAFMKTASRILR